MWIFRVLPLFISLSVSAATNHLVADLPGVLNTCRFSQDSTEAGRNSYFSKVRKQAGERGDYQVYGVKFKNESPELVFRFMQLTTRVDFFGEPKPKEQVNIIREYPDLRKCSSVLCAVDVIFGPEVGRIKLFLLSAYDLNSSHLAYPQSSLMRPRELKNILEALDFMPPHLKRLSLNQKMIHFKRGYHRPGGDSVLANASMEFFDNWSDWQDPTVRILAVYHEFAHNWSRTSDYKQLDESEEWKEVTGWISEGKLKGDKYKTGFVSRYAGTNPAEDFAETAVAYRFTPKLLKKISPGRYEFMKMMVYGGLEFLDGCPEQAPQIAALNNLFHEEADTKASVQKVIDKCGKEYAQYILGYSRYNEVKDCLSRELYQQAFMSLTNGKKTKSAPRTLYDVNLESKRSFFEVLPRFEGYLRENFRKACDSNVNNLDSEVKRACERQRSSVLKDLPSFEANKEVSVLESLYETLVAGLRVIIGGSN